MIVSECNYGVCVGEGEGGYGYSARRDVWEEYDRCYNQPEPHSDRCYEHGGTEDSKDFIKGEWEYHFDPDDVCEHIKANVKSSEIEARIKRGMPRGEELLANYGK